MGYSVKSAFLIFCLISVKSSFAWPWSENPEDNLVNFDLALADDSDLITGLSEIEDPEGIEEGEGGEEEALKEENLRCGKNFNRNLHKLLKSIIPQNSTLNGREARQEEEGEDLFQSMLNLELSQVVWPVLKILGSAAAANATAIDESYKSLPYAVRYQVTDLIKFTVDLLQTT